MKIIFLDIDGVHNHRDWYKQVKKYMKDNNLTDDDFFHFDPECVERTNRITDKTGAKIVVSSTWRKGKTLEQLQELFKKVGFTGDVIGKTPVLNYRNHIDLVPRGCEIHHWINNNKGILGTNLLNWKDYVIIDDDGDMLYWQRKNFFQTDGSGGGLTENMTYKIINFLK